MEGWRCAFHLVALVSLVTSGLTLWLAVDPRRKLAVRLLSASQAIPDACEQGAPELNSQVWAGDAVLTL